MNWASRGYIEPDENKQIEVVSVKEYKKLAKYKRAFEILKEKFSLDKTEIFGNGYLYFLNGIDSCWEISQEEYELLEELMSGEED